MGVLTIAELTLVAAAVVEAVADIISIASNGWGSRHRCPCGCIQSCIRAPRGVHLNVDFAFPAKVSLYKEK